MFRILDVIMGGYKGVPESSHKKVIANFKELWRKGVGLSPEEINGLCLKSFLKT